MERIVIDAGRRRLGAGARHEAAGGAHALCPRGRGDFSDSNFHPALIPGNLV